MRLLLVAGLVAWCALSALPAVAQDSPEHPGEHHPGEFTTRMVIKDMFVQDVFLPQGVNLGNLTATPYKSGNDKSSGPVLVTIQAERVTTHLPPLLQTIPGGTVSE